MVVIISPLHLEQGLYSISFHVYGKGQLLRATCRCCWERLCLSITSYYCFSPKCLFFLLSFSIPSLLGEEIYQKSNPQTRLKAQIKMEREIERGGEKRRGGDQSNFLWRRIALLGLSGGVPVLQLKANFFY